MINTKVSLEELNKMGKNTLVAHLGIRFTHIAANELKATMPVDPRTLQPYGLLHGGASVALAETLGSVAAHLSVDTDRFLTVGLEINANHIRSVRSGYVTGTARPVHTGRSTQVWTIEIENEEGQLVCISRITMAVVAKKQDA